ncbi:hypothetical protein [Flavobacterium suzhouense]|uniref:Uncharacterized protein n=1 Tax=Flavobacterium suzhouense TaxID=1529638 RepID=A0ABW5NPI3_9FLAO
MESKQQEYTEKILGQLQQLFSEENENRINISELEDNSNASDFFHALANLAPTVVYTKLTQKEIGTLDFNHIANRLCFQNCFVKQDSPESQSQSQSQLAATAE